MHTIEKYSEESYSEMIDRYLNRLREKIGARHVVLTTNKGEIIAYSLQKPLISAKLEKMKDLIPSLLTDKPGLKEITIFQEGNIESKKMNVSELLAILPETMRINKNSKIKVLLINVGLYEKLIIVGPKVDYISHNKTIFSTIDSI